jgi:hypothetical protein
MRSHVIWRAVGRTTEVNTDVRLHITLQSAQVCTIQDTVPHATEQLVEIWTAEVCAGLQLGQGIYVCANAVEHDVLCGIEIKLLCEVGVDA